MSVGERHIAFCPHCGNTTPQRVAFRHSYYTKWYGSDGQTDDDDRGPECEAVLCICETCNEVLLYDGVAESETMSWPALHYPQGPNLHRSVPDRVRTVYEEAFRIKRQAPNAFAVMIRRALEEICDDRQIPSGTLSKRLKALAESGQLPAPLAAVTDVLRVLGNAGAHASPRSVTVPQTWAIDDFFRVIVEYVYVAPTKLAEFQKRLKRLDAAERRASRQQPTPGDAASPAPPPQ